jgi:hypothetical protein
VFECVEICSGLPNLFCTAGLDGHSVGGDGRSMIKYVELVGVQATSWSLFPSATTSSSWPFAVTLGIGDHG